MAATLSVDMTFLETISTNVVGMTEAEEEPLVSALIQPFGTLGQGV